MVFNALKRIFKPEYRIVACTECKIYYLQRRRVISGDWEYLTDDAFGFWAMEFNSYSEAREYAKSCTSSDLTSCVCWLSKNAMCWITNEKSNYHFYCHYRWLLPGL